MKRLTLVGALVIASICATPRRAFAEDEPADEGERRVGVGIEGFFVLPVGNFGDATGPLGGPLTRFGYRVLLPLELSLRVGYFFALSKDRGGGVSTRYDLLPIWVEARLFLQNAYQGLYGALSGGMNIYLPTITPPVPGPEGDRLTELRRRFGAAGGLGYVVSARLPVDFRLQIMFPNLIGQSDDLKEKTDCGVSLSGGYTLQF